MRIKYDTETCTRCGGSGHYSYFRGDTRCFKCKGSGLQLTRAAKKAKERIEAWADEHLTVPASSIEPGDRIVMSSLTVAKATWTVTERTTTLGKGFGTSREGVEGTDSFREWQTLGATVLHYQRKTSLGVKEEGYQLPAHQGVRKAWTAEAMQAAIDSLPNRKGFTVEP